MQALDICAALQLLSYFLPVLFLEFLHRLLQLFVLGLCPVPLVALSLLILRGASPVYVRVVFVVFLNLCAQVFSSIGLIVAI